MLVWTRWGISIPFLGFLGAIIGNYGALAVGQQLQTDASWLMAAGNAAGALAASLLIMMLREWRSTRGGEKQRRALIDEKTGQRVEFDDPGDTFFWLHSSVWVWLALAIGAVSVVVAIFTKTPLHEI
ncbi:MAG: hypothetical protein JNM59_02145 [Hyphomonadaceae bacterium]|nr:hypothetical protein [Hyphomonadaceae bacterium]